MSLIKNPFPTSSTHLYLFVIHVFHCQYCLWFLICSFLNREHCIWFIWCPPSQSAIKTKTLLASLINYTIDKRRDILRERDAETKSWADCQCLLFQWNDSYNNVFDSLPGITFQKKWFRSLCQNYYFRKENNKKIILIKRTGNRFSL